jgi:hypothetical protein
MRLEAMRFVAALALLLCAGTAAAQAVGLGMEDVPLRPSELKLLKRIEAVDPSFKYGDRVKRYFRTHPTTKNRIPLRVEVIADKTNGLFFGEYMSFSMLIDEPAGIVTYEFDAGTAHRGRGTVVVTEFTCGTSKCSTRVERNGRVVYEGGS